MPRRPLEFDVALAASQGARDYQEDCAGVWTPATSEVGERTGAMLAVLSDGMGGHVSGEVASKLVCNHSIEKFKSLSGEPDARLDIALTSSNEALERAIREQPALAGMGCTAIIAYLDDSGLRWASVGDSALMVYRSRQLIRLNDDHSLGALLDKQADARKITREEASSSPHRRSLMSALTGGKIAHKDIQRAPWSLLPGDWVIVASDGLETLSGDSLAAIIDRHGDGSAKDLANLLLAEVDRRKAPNQDNTSVIVIRALAADESRTTRMLDPANGRAEPGDGNTRAADTELMVHAQRGVVIGHANNAEAVATEPMRGTGAAVAERRGKARMAVVIAGVLITLGGIYLAWDTLVSQLWRPVTAKNGPPPDNGGAKRTP